MTEHDSENVLKAVARICASGSLGKSSRQKTLLQYLVQEELDGRGPAIKAYTIALDVFGRPNSFDPATDSIVRVEMGRLRQSLQHYYATYGDRDAITITIPKGSYRPHFSQDRANLQTRTNADQLSVIVLPFKSLATDPISESAAGGISHQLFTEMSRIKAITLVRSGLRQTDDLPRDIKAFCRERGAKYVVQGAIQPLADGLRLMLDLNSGETGKVIWARAYNAVALPTSEEQDVLISKIATDLRPLFYNMEKLYLESLPEETLSAEQLYLLATWISGNASSTLSWELKRVELAKRALSRDANFGKVHSVLADKLIYLAAVDPNSDLPTLVDASRDHAKLARSLAPDDPDVFINLTMHYWHLGDLKSAALAASRVLELEPTNGLARLLNLAIPYTCKVAPPDILDRVHDFDASMAPDNPVRWFSVTWASRLYLNELDFENTLKLELEARQIFQTPDTAMRAATALFHLGREGEAKEWIDEQIPNWPTLDPHHLTNVSLARRRVEYDGDDPVLRAYQEFADFYRDASENRVIPINGR